MEIRVLTALLLVTSALEAASTAPGITFYKDVLPVLQKRCQECHRPGEAAPMSLLTYKDARPWAKAIRQAVISKKMPPWFADAHFGKFSNDRSLTQAEIDTVTAWVDGGAKEGDPKLAQANPTFAEGWAMGKPDVVIEMPTAFKVPASGTIDYTYIVVPTGFTEDKWVEKVEVRPGDNSRGVVHHIVLLNRPPSSGFMKGISRGVAFTPPHNKEPANRPVDNGKGSFFGLGTDGSEMVSVYVPGGMPYETRPGQARLIKAGSDLIFQIHYTANGTETLDRSRVGIVFAKQPPKERVVNTFIMNNHLHIPPGAPDHRVDALVKINEDVVLQSLFPHMHVRGKAFEFVARFPTGETQTLLRVPRYDFNWQLTYDLEKPILLPKGTEITATAWYDNSPNNKFNPDPKSDVYWGDQTWEEMLAGFVDFVIPANMNPSDIVRGKQTVAQQ